jgi:hypothetical protein
METPEILMVVLKEGRLNVSKYSEIKLLISLVVGPHEFLPCENEMI